MDQSNNKKELLEDFATLVNLVETLRGPDGCPWDKKQTQKSLTPYILEEAYELAEAIDSQNQNSIQEELGDYLFQVILQTQVAKDSHHFDLHQVIKALNAKMVRRHPHVFGSSIANGMTEKKDLKSIDLSTIQQNWELIKDQEKSDSDPILNSTGSISPKESESFQNIKSPSEAKKVFNLPKALPALLASTKIGVKTERWKFDWNSPLEVLEKVKEELQEVIDEISEKTPSTSRIQAEIGDLLFSVAQLARHLQIDPEASLREANQRFQRRFEKVVELSQLEIIEFQNLPLEEKELLWKKAKSLLKETES